MSMRTRRTLTRWRPRPLHGLGVAAGATVLACQPLVRQPLGTQVEVPAAVEPDEGAAAAAKRRGDEAFVAADYPEAVAAYTRALRHDTSSHALWANRSAASLRMGDHEAALADARIARTVNPAFTKVLGSRLCGPSRIRLHGALVARRCDC